MGAHARAGSRLRPAARAAGAAVLAVVAGTVLVGLGGIGGDTPTAALPTSDVAAAHQVPGADLAAPVVVPPAAPQATTAPTATPRSTFAPAATAPPAPAATAPTGAVPAAIPTLVPGTPCTATARACVDLLGRKAWLLDAGRVTRGPVTIMTGDRDDPTPRGTFTVQWKAEEYTSREYLRQMPHAIFFADGGIAFHEGRQDTPSAGCVKLVKQDAVAWFAHLQIGDEVQIH